MNRIPKLKAEQVFDDPHLPVTIRRIPRHAALTQPHGHEFHELVVIVEGKGIHQVENERYVIEQGDVFVLLGDLTHFYPAVDRLSLINVLFEPGLLSPGTDDIVTVPGFQTLFEIEPRLRRTGRYRNRLRLDPAALAMTLQVIAEIETELAGRRPGYRTMVTAHLRRMVCHLSRCADREGTGHGQSATQISRVLRLIERNYGEKLSSARLCREAGMSSTNFNRRFREVTGCSPIAYVLRHRIAQAKRMLQMTDMSITDVGLEIGFCDGNYFARQFRRITGDTPREFRRRCDLGHSRLGLR